MIIAHTDSNDIDFAIECKADDADKVKFAMRVGVAAWYEAAHDNIEENEYWSKEEIESFYGAGYAEPTMELLDRWGIAYTLKDFKVDEDDNIVCDELVRR